MTSITNAIIIYGICKYDACPGYPIGTAMIFCALVDIAIAAIISAG